MDSIETESRIWRRHKLIFGFAKYSALCVVLSTILLYSFYGPLTPNHNRYYHSFNPISVPFGLLILAVASMVVLYLPAYLLAKSPNPQYFRYGIFPAKNSPLAKVVSATLSILNLGSGLVFTVCFTLITLSYIFDTGRVMADDLETLLLYAAYWGCLIVWGIIDLIYWLIYNRDWI